MKGPYDSKDAAEDTDSSQAETDAAWHDARSDDQNSDSPSTDYGSRDATYSDYDTSWDRD
jgi:hypothetical protein